MTKLGLEKEEELDSKLPTSAGLQREQANFRKKKKNLCFTDYTKDSDYVDHDKLWKALREMGISDHFTCLLRNLSGSVSNS